ncbi:hypothetical protein BT96DRAFT_82104 [Gymnopus androsaceus JB14]|uniref:HTH APSES-type domain-containing protein n=1 Tax=Gymnopus androsaceus JB14 TaxID=1447944 RepID=A0A6A4I6S5_9AGAR|nr:hypothetical protein BT96DRAFT_82104 [Gymnopus androsaceus JB14]
MPRPKLPLEHKNPNVALILSSGNLPPVKYQILNCQGNDILVGRLKIETSTGTGHAFILRRYDTGAVSLTTMFRAAFPKADDQSEKDEVQWVKENYDLSGNNGSSKDPSITRLAGTWVSPELARELGQAYLLGNLISLVVDAHPDPDATYRRSGKGATTPKAPSSVDIATKPQSVVSPTAAPNPSKRRKESSPVRTTTTIPASPPPEKRILPRRTTRTKSPAPIPLVKTPSRKSVIRREREREREPKAEVLTPGGSDETAVEDEEVEAVEDVAGEELRQQDIAEQKILIEDLKAKRDAAESGSQPAVVKRSREEEEEALRFNFKEPEVGERAIATNRRVGGYFEEPRHQSLAWGIAAFAFGIGAVTFLPNLL